MSRLDPPPATPARPVARLAAGADPLPEPADPISARPALLAGWLTAALLVPGIGGWATFAVLDGAILANGHMAADRLRHLVQHPDGGRVLAVLVAEGARVDAGQPVLRLDPGPLEAERALLADQRAALVAQRARLEAERDGTADWPGATDDPHLAGQARLHVARRDLLALQLDGLSLRAAQARAQRGGLAAQARALEAEIAEQARDLAVQEALFAAGNLPAARLVPLRREALRLSGARSALLAEIAGLDGRITELEVQARTLHAQRQSEVEGGLREAESRLAELDARLAQVADRLERLVLRAPVAGHVHALALAGAGGVLRPAEPALEVVPPGPALLALAAIRPEDADRLIPGQAARVLLPSTGGRDRPDLPGRLLRLSADAVEDPRTGQRHILAEVAIDPPDPAALAGRALRAGLPVEVHLLTGARSPMSWLLAPLTVYLDRALRPD